MIRVSTNMMFTNSTLQIAMNQRKLLDLQEQITTNKKINRPSDDPVGAAQASDIKRILETLKQYSSNLDQADIFLTQTEDALTTVAESLVRASEIASGVNNGQSSVTEYQAAKAEIENIRGEILNVANRKVGDRYLFAGYETLNQPFTAAGNYVGGSGQDIEVEIGNREYVTINKCGDDIFTSGTNIFATLDNLINALNAQDQSAIGQQLEYLDNAHAQVVTQIADLGSRANRVSYARDNVDSLNFSYTNMLSNIEDADAVAVSTEFAKQQQIYLSSLEVASRIFQQSFLDFLV